MSSLLANPLFFFLLADALKHTVIETHSCKARSQAKILSTFRGK